MSGGTKTDRFEIEKEQAGYYNMGEGYVAITDSENSEKSAKITQYNCELSDMQIIKIYGFLQKHPELESPTASPKERSKNLKLADKKLDVKFKKKQTGEEVTMSLSDLPEAIMPDLFKALKKSTLTRKKEEFREKVDDTKDAIGAAKEDLREHIENKVEEIQKKVEDRIGTIRDENGIPTVFGEELKMFPKLREYYIKAKKTPLYDKFRHSGLNPYHFGVRKVKADSLDEAKRIIREDAKKAAALQKKVKAQFIWNGTRYYTDRYCPPQQEFEEDGVVLRAGVNVADRIPRNKEGKLDLLAEEPILISIIPVEGPALIGHACMQYKDQVLNRLLPSIHTDPLYQKYKEYSEYFYVYPSQIGVDGDKLYEAIKEHNIEHMDDKYNPLTRNCAQNVARVLKKVGVKDFDFYGPDWLGLGYATPGNNPFGKGILPWCRKHGVRVHLDEVAAYDKRYPMTNAENKKRRKNMRQIKKSREDIIER